MKERETREFPLFFPHFFIFDYWNDLEGLRERGDISVLTVVSFFTFLSLYLPCLWDALLMRSALPVLWKMFPIRKLPGEK